MRAEELWKAYCEKENIDIDTPYEAWGFGDVPVSAGRPCINGNSDCNCICI